MTVYMTQTEYAEHRGISQPRVSKLISTGKISDCIKKISGRKLIDRDKADAALEEKLDRVYNRPETVAKRKKNTKTSNVERIAVIKSAGLTILPLADAQQLRENYTAALKKLEYEAKKRELIPADEARTAFADTIISARAKILSIKGILAPLIKEFVSDQDNFGVLMTRIDDTIRNILTEMADAETNFS